MMMKSIAFAILAAVIFTSSSFGQSQSKLQPTEVVYYSLKAMAENPAARRLPTIKQYFDRLETENLDEDQNFALGEVYFLNFKPGESLTQYEMFMDGADLRARIAWQKAMQIEFSAYDRHEKVEGMVEEYWLKFPPMPQDIWHADWQIKNLANKYLKEGNHQKVVDIVTREVNRLPTNAPYRSLRLPAVFMNSFVAVGQEDAARTMLRQSVIAMRQGLANHLSVQKTSINIFPSTPLVPGTYFRMEEGLQGAAFSPGYPSAGLRTRQYLRLIAEIELSF